ncbi:MAG: YkgJ family cysteine cluster protein [Desulfovibrionaceae bacterium]
MTRPDPNECRRCGQCCTQGGPVLHAQDLDLFARRVLDLADVVTLRAGEPVFDNPHDATAPIAREMLKVRGRGATWICHFYEPDERACAIYDNRPAECRALLCSRPDDLLAMYETGRITRADVLPAGHPMLELAAEHDARCPAARAVELGRRLAAAPEAERPAAIAELEPLLHYDRELRRTVGEKTGLPPEALDFLFGRPLPAVLAPLGVLVSFEPGAVRVRIRRPAGGPR